MMKTLPKGEIIKGSEKSRKAVRDQKSTYLAIWTNALSNLDKYIFKFGKIYISI